MITRDSDENSFIFVLAVFVCVRGLCLGLGWFYAARFHALSPLKSFNKNARIVFVSSPMNPSLKSQHLKLYADVQSACGFGLAVFRFLAKSFIARQIRIKASRTVQLMLVSGLNCPSLISIVWYLSGQKNA